MPYANGAWERVSTLMSAMRDVNGHLKVIRWSVAGNNVVNKMGVTTSSDPISSTAID